MTSSVENGSFTVVVSLTCKAVGTVEVTGVRNVEAERLYDARGLCLELICHRLKCIGGKELARRLEFTYLLVAFLDILT